MDKIKSRKFIIASVISVFSAFAPILYKAMGVSDVVSLSALAILGSIAVGYGVINVKDAKNKLMATMPPATETKVEVNNTEVKVG